MERTVALIGLPIVAVLMLLTALDLGGQATLWENAHWTAAGALATAVATISTRRTHGLERRIGALVSFGAAAWLIGQLAWDVQVAIGWSSVPGPSDVGFLGLVVPGFLAVAVALHRRLPRVETIAVHLDVTAIFLAITTMILVTFGQAIARAGVDGAAVAIAYPIVHLATAISGIAALLTIRTVPGSRGYLFLAGVAILGVAWVDWLRDAVVALPSAGSIGHYAFSIGIIAVGFGATGWRLGEVAGRRFSQLAASVLGGLPVLVVLIGVLALLRRSLGSPDLDLADLTAVLAIVLTGMRQAFLVHERGRLLDASGEARREVEVALAARAKADTRYQVLVEHVPAAVYIDVSDPTVSDGGRLAYMSPQIEAILGFPPEAFVDDPEFWPTRIHPEDRNTTLAAYVTHWETARPLRIDYRMIAADGSVVWVHDEAYAMEDDEAGGRRVSQGLLADTTEQKRLEAQLLHDALHDPLTGLANRVLFREHLERALNRSRRRRTNVAVLFLDIDDFKVVNDSLGHGAGDRILVEVAQRLTATIRTEDVAARQGGDEFTVMVERVRDVQEAKQLADRLTEALRRPIEIDGRWLVVEASVGIALATSNAGADDVLAHADAAMYAAKGLGKARHAVFDPSMRRRAQSRLEMEAELRAAIEAGAFELHYQPIVEVAGGWIVGFEALVRWRHPDRGLVGPVEFIPLAEETGQIVPLGRWITGEACRQLRAWRDSGVVGDGLTVSVNVSPRQAIEPTFATDVRAALLAARLDPASLVLEITESLTLQESVAGDTSLRQLRDLGVQLEIDDFGTGFSALEYFKRFAVHGLKIDRSFVSGLGRSREDTAIITATLAFAAALDLSVTAEGVETRDQLERLRELGCQRAQGYLFAPPVPAAEIPAILEASGPRRATRVA